MNSLSKTQISQPRNQNSASNDTNLLNYEEFVYSVKEKLKTDPHFLTKFFEPIKKELLLNNVDLTDFLNLENCSMTQHIFSNSWINITEINKL